MRISTRATVAFVVIAVATAWLIALPLWLGLGLSGIPATVIIASMMFAPAIATLIVMLVVRPVPKGERLRFLGIWPLRPAKRTILWSLAALFGMPLIAVAAFLLAVALGWAQLDLVGFSGYRALIAAAGATLPADAPMALIVVSQLVMIPVAGATINAVAAFGEEVGWRGFLTPALRSRMGVWPTLVITGVIWGLWHAPVILLGYNFGRPDVSGLALMVLGCVLMGITFGWLRLHTGSVWPAVFGHGAFNAAAGIALLFSSADAPLDLALVGSLSISTSIVLAAVCAVLALTGALRRENALARP